MANGQEPMAKMRNGLNSASSGQVAAGVNNGAAEIHHPGAQSATPPHSRREPVAPAMWQSSEGGPLAREVAGGDSTTD